MWRLEPLLKWLKSRADYAIERRQIDVAHRAMQVNLVRAIARLEWPIQSEIRALVA